MKKGKIVFLALAIGILFVASNVYADVSGSGGAAPYLRMGVGARALGMGGAFVAVADDATARVKTFLTRYVAP